MLLRVDKIRKEVDKMYLKNKDLETLKEIEIELWNTNSKNYFKLFNLIENLLNQKEVNNSKNWNRIKNKRKINKNYARKKVDKNE